MTGTFAGFSLGIGLAGLAGFRAFFPLVMVSLIAKYSREEFFRSPLSFLSYSWILIILLFFLAFEILATRIPSNNGIQELPVFIAKILSGALLFAAVFSGISVFWGLLIGGFFAGMGMVIKALLNSFLINSFEQNNFSLATIIEDMIAIIGTVLIILIPSVSILLFSYVIYLAVKKFRQHKRVGGRKKVRVLR